MGDEGEKLLLRAVVEVPFNPAPFGLGGHREPPAGLLQFGDPRRQGRAEARGLLAQRKEATSYRSQGQR